MDERLIQENDRETAGQGGTRSAHRARLAIVAADRPIVFPGVIKGTPG
jgi:hypothetical protein